MNTSVQWTSKKLVAALIAAGVLGGMGATAVQQAPFAGHAQAQAAADHLRVGGSAGAVAAFCTGSGMFAADNVALALARSSITAVSNAPTKNTTAA